MRWFISIRYLLTHLRQTLVCIAGVTISVTMFIGMDAMMQGFQDKFIIETVESSGHITVNDEPRATRTPILQQAYPEPHALLDLQGTKPRDKIEKIKNPTGLMATLRRVPGVTSVSAVVKGDATAIFGTKTYGMLIYGIDPDEHTRVTTIGENMAEGSFDRLKTTANGIILGRGIALTLGAQVGDNLVLNAAQGGRVAGRVVGIFDTGVTPVDYSRAYMLLGDAQTLLDRKNIINEIVLRTTDYTRAREMAAQIEGLSGYKTESWQESNENFLKIFRIQQMITYIITGALLVVAAFGVLNILIMAVLERVNDIAILKSFGLSRNDITLVYVMQGLVIGLIGSLIGLGLGKLTIEALRRVPIQMEGLVKAEGLLMSEYPGQYVFAFIAAVLGTLLASAYPARRAARYDPVEVIRGAH